MRTNQIMVRRMGRINVLQRTKDAYFNVTALISEYNKCVRAAQLSNDPKYALSETIHEGKENGQNQGNLNPCNPRDLELLESQIDTSKCYQNEKRLDNYMALSQTTEFIASIARHERIAPTAVVKASRGKHGGTWVHPMLFVDVCLWIDPDFKYRALKFIQDKMLEYRDDAGEAYKALSSAVARVVPADRMRAVMATVAKGINYVLWNAHSDGERNLHATDGDMRRLHEYERHLAATIDDGFIRSEEELVGHLRRQWGRRWGAGARPAAGAGREEAA